MSNLRNVTMAFGGESSPTVVTKSQVLTLIKVINDEQVTSTFSGHISMLSGTLDAAQAYLLATKNITFHGETTPVSYTISVNKAAPNEGDDITFSVSGGLPVSVFRFEVSRVEIISGDITPEEVKSLCVFDGNVLHVANSGKNIRWSAIIYYNVWPMFDVDSKKEFQISMAGVVKVNSINIVGEEEFTVNSSHSEKTFTIEYNPTDYTVPIGTPVLSCDDSHILFKNITKQSFVVVINTTETFETDIIVETAGVSFTKHIKVKAAGASEVNVTGDVTPSPSNDAVDLGLPSGLLWGTKNLGANKPEEYGLFYQWGSINGHAVGDGYNFASKNYPESDINTDLTPEQDAAHVALKGGWRMPTVTDIRELINGTTQETAYKDGTKQGILCTSKTNGKTLLIVTNGEISGTSMTERDSIYLLSKTYKDTLNTYILYNADNATNLGESFGIRCKGHGIRPVTDIMPQGNSKMSFTATGQKSATFSFNGLVPMNTATAEFASTSTKYQIVAVSKTGITVKCLAIDTIEENTINLTFEDVEGNVITAKIDVTNKIVPTITIDGDDTFYSANGIGQSVMSFGKTPASYNASVSFVSIVSSNPLIKVKNSSVNGFTVYTESTVDTQTATITATLKVDGEDVVVTKNITAEYKPISNFFKVYQNSAWVVPNTGVEVKVGDNVAEYIGDGYWQVDASIIDDTLDVISNGVVLGKYGKTEYSDGSSGDIVYVGSASKNSTGSINHIQTDSPIGKSYSVPLDTGYKFTNDDFISHIIVRNVYITGGNVIFYDDEDNYESVKTGAFLKDSIIELNREMPTGRINVQGTWNGLLTLEYYLIKKASFTPDLSLPSTSLIAKNGTLNEEITPTTPNGGTVVLTNVSSSNSAITATIVDGKIKLTGTIADGAPQTSTLSISYTVNGYSRSYEVEVTATYEKEVDPRKEIVGAVLCSDGSIVIPDIADDGYTVNSVDVGDKTPIGVLVIPASHMDDGKARWMSLDFMNVDNPDTGSQSQLTMYWGGNGVDLSTLPNLDTCILLSGATNSLSRLGSKTQYNPSTFTVQKEDGLWYYNDANSGPAPFTSDGGINSAYRQLATGNFDGIGNTDKIIATVTVAWQSGAISNTFDAGNYPAVCCCRRYHTTGTNAGDWYLPAIGELGYIIYNNQLIGNVLTKINKITNSNGMYLLSSTENSSTHVRTLYLGSGSVNTSSKTSSCYCRAFLAF